MTQSFRFGTVGIPISTPKNPGGSIGGIKRISELNLSALELAWVYSVRISEKTCQHIKETCEEENVALSIHAPYFINLNAKPDEWPNARKRLMDAAHFGNLSGATDIIFHPGSYFGKDPEDVLPGTIERLSKCILELREQSNFVTLRPETMGKSALLGSLQDTLRMSSEIEGVEPCLDFAHLHARTGDNTMNSFDEWCTVLELYANSLGQESLKRLSIHLSGIEYGPKGERKHLPMSDSDFDLTALFNALHKYHCEGRIYSESPIMEEDALFFQAQWILISEGGKNPDTPL